MASILAVDDSVSLREMLAYTLRSAGHEVIEAGDGDQAYALARERVVDLVITDLNMPNRDGLTLIRDLRQLDGYRFTPLLMLTTESSPDLKQAGREAGATGWMVKPFDPERLLQTVRRVID